MSPYTLPERTYISYGQGDWRFPSSTWYVEHDLGADDGLYPDIGGYSDGLVYQEDGVRYLDNDQFTEGRPYRDCHQHEDEKYTNYHGKPRRRVRRTCRSPHSERPHKEPPLSAHDECSRGNGDEDSEQVSTISNQKENVAPIEETSEEVRIEALAEEKFIKKCEEEEQRRAAAKESEERWLIEKKEIEELYKAQLEKALADQRAAIMKEAEEKENAIKAELERQAQAKRAELELIEKTEAAVREADRKAAADKLQADQEKADAEREEAARREAQAKEDAERLYAERLEKEANDKRAAEKDIAEKENAEKMERILCLLGQLIAEDDLMEKTLLEKNPVLTEKNPSEKTSISKRQDVPAGYNKSVIAELKQLLPQVTNGQDLEEAAFQEEEVNCPINEETESSPAEVSGCASGDGSPDGQTKEDEAKKDEETGRESARTAKRLKSRGEHREEASKKSRAKKKRKVALTAMKWMVGRTHLSR